MSGLPKKADQIHELIAQLRRSIDNWDAHQREEDRLAVLSDAQMIKKYLDEIIEAVRTPSR